MKFKARFDLKDNFMIASKGTTFSFSSIMIICVIIFFVNRGFLFFFWDDLFVGDLGFGDFGPFTVNLLGCIPQVFHFLSAAVRDTSTEP